MPFLITFLEGIIAFLSPCTLPMLPLYITYFAGGGETPGKSSTARTLIRACAFVAGFTVIFTAMGLFAGVISTFLIRWRTPLQIITGAIVILFGLSYLGLFRLPFLSGSQRAGRADSLLSAFLFGIVYSVSLSPCTGAFLGSALMMASNSGTAGMGALLLITYSLGLGLPFLLSAILIDQLKGAFAVIKRHYNLINAVSGGFLILLGLLMATGLMNRLLNALM